MTTSSSPHGVRISGWGHAVGSQVVTNDDLAAMGLDTSDEWIASKTGIRERRYATADESTATLATAACRAALETAGVAAEEIDLLVVATCTPEQPMPHTGAFVGEALGLRCGSFDLNTACSGFVYSLVSAAQFVHGGLRHVLVVGAETMSRITDPADRGTRVLFGDGAGAVVLSRHDGPTALLGWDLGCDGSATGVLEIPAGGSRRPADEDTVAERGHFIKMIGGEVFRRAVQAASSSTARALEAAGLAASDLDHFVPHQANVHIIEGAIEILGVPMERVVIDLDRFGNTSAASVPIALSEAASSGRLRDGDVLALTGFGAGMSWASAVVRWGRA